MALLGIFDKLRDVIARPAPKVSRSQMSAEIAAPGAIFDRPPFEGHYAFGMRPDLLAGVIQAADSGSSREWFILAEEIEELFPHYGAVLSKRRRQVCQLPVTVEQAGDSAEQVRDAELVREWLKTGVLGRALFDIMDGVGKGFSVCEIIWDTTPEHFWPARLAYRRPSWFEVSWADGETILMRDQAGLTEMADHKFLVHRHPSKSGSVIRSGLTRQVAWLWMYQTFTLRDWAIFVQSYGLPIRVGRYGPEASEDDKRVLWRAVMSIAGNMGAIFPKSMEMEFVKGGDKVSDTKLYMDRADWIDREVSKIVLGSTAGTDAIAGGHAVGKEHRQVEEDVERYDAGLLSNTLTMQIIPAMIDFTYGPPKDGQYPVLHIGRPDEVPLQVLGPMVAALADAGMTFKADEIRDRLGLTKPEANDEVFGGTPAATPGGEEPPAEAHDIPPIKTLPSLSPLATQSQTRWLAGLIAMHAQNKPDLIAQMTERLAGEAASALGGMTDQLRAVFDAASDMGDLAHRLSRLDLDADAFAEAMTRGLALAELVGQAALVQQVSDDARRRPGA
jgi:phage gp29-like protein